MRLNVLKQIFVFLKLCDKYLLQFFGHLRKKLLLLSEEIKKN